MGVRADSESAEAAIEALGAESPGEVQGWFWGRPPHDEDLDAAVSALAREGESPAVGGWVADSDCAYLVFASPDGAISARVSINETLPYGEPVDGLPDLWGDHDARGRAFEDLARWSSEHAPRAVEAEVLLREMPGWPESSPPTDGPFFADDDPWYDEDGETGWVFAEDGVRLVYHRLGLPSLDEAVFSHSPSAPDEAQFGGGQASLPDQAGFSVYGGDQRLRSSLTEFLGASPYLVAHVWDETLENVIRQVDGDVDPERWVAERYWPRSPEQDPPWVAGALELVRAWLSETGTPSVWVHLHFWAAGVEGSQMWAVTADDTE
jgi:hypothetical protein